MFDFYRRQIEDFNRTEAELQAFFEEIANSDSITNAEYCKLFDIAMQKLKTI